jgi:hypothetical protein
VPGRIRAFLLAQSAAFVAAPLVHFGVVATGYEHRKAGIAESVIAAVLLAGLAVTWLRPRWVRSVGLAVQAFALAGTLVGAFTIAIGVGPRTTPDVVFHGCLVALLVIGLVVTARTPRETTAPPRGDPARAHV